MKHINTNSESSNLRACIDAEKLDKLGFGYVLPVLAAEEVRT